MKQVEVERVVEMMLVDNVDLAAGGTVRAIVSVDRRWMMSVGEGKVVGEEVGGRRTVSKGVGHHSDVEAGLASPHSG